MNTLFLIAIVLEAVFGISLLVVPGQFMSLTGITLDEISTSLARMFGSALITFPILLWFARKSEHMDFKRGACYTMFVYYLVCGVLLLSSQLAGQMNVMGWSLVGLHVIMVIWFGYYIFK